MKKLAWPAACLALLAAPTYADDTPFYVGATLGHVSVDRGSVSSTAGNTGGIDGSGSAESLALGGWFTDSFGAELAYHDYGNPAAFMQSGLSVKQCPAAFSCPKLSGISAEALARMELVPLLDGNLRAGFLQWHAGSPGDALIGKTTGTAFIYGIGVTRHFDYGLNLDISYERSNFTTEETRIGLSYSF